MTALCRTEVSRIALLIHPLTRPPVPGHGLLSVLACYVAANFLVPPLAGPGRGGATLAWDGPLRITLSFLPFAAILGVVLATIVRRARRTPTAGGER